MKKVLGIAGLLAAVCVFTAIASPYFLTLYNIENLLRRTALFGIISIGAAFVIMGGGIDLSIGSVICFVGVMTPWLLVTVGWSPWLVLPVILLSVVAIGVIHGLLITRFGLQPFVVTLCGLLIYRGVARGFSGDQSQGFKGQFETLRGLGGGRFPEAAEFAIPIPLFFLIGILIVAAVLLHRTRFGRYLLAIGRNEQAARYSGIDTRRVTLLSYVICSSLAGFGGLLFVLDNGSAQPVDFGNFYELYAIAAAVLGGCSLQGGVGVLSGVVIGAAVMQVLRNAITLIDWIPNNVEFAVIGIVILCGVVADEVVKRIAARRARDAMARR